MRGVVSDAPPTLVSWELSSGRPLPVSIPNGCETRRRQPLATWSPEVLSTSVLGVEVPLCSSDTARYDVNVAPDLSVNRLAPGGKILDGVEEVLGVVMHDSETVNGLLDSDE